MKKKAYNKDARFQTIANACRTTGLSQGFLRQGCRNGTIPHLRQGRVYYVDVQAFNQLIDDSYTQRNSTNEV